MFKYSLSETNQPPRCQRCGGQVIRSYDDISCLQCGASHTEEGKLVTQSAQQFEALLALQEMMPLRAEIT